MFAATRPHRLPQLAAFLARRAQTDRAARDLPLYTVPLDNSDDEDDSGPKGESEDVEQSDGEPATTLIE